MGLRKHKSSLDVWLGQGTSPERFWKLIFFFLSRFILVFCLLHYVGIAYPQIGWVFPGPASDAFWACCILFTAIFAVVFYVLRGKRKGSVNDSKTESSPAMVVEEKREVRHGGVSRATFASVVEKKQEGGQGSISRATSAPVVEEKREGRHGRVGRATFAPEPELEEERSENQRDRRE